MEDDGWGWLRELLRQKGLSKEEAQAEVERQRGLLDDLEFSARIPHLIEFVQSRGWNFDERPFLQAMAQERGLAFVDLDRVSPDPRDIALIDPETAHIFQMMVVKKDGKNVWVAMADPTNRAAIEAVKLATDCRAIPVVALPGLLATWIDRHYPLP